MLDFEQYSTPRLRVIAVTPGLAPGGAEIWLSTLARHSQTVRYTAIVSANWAAMELSNEFGGTEILVAESGSDEHMRTKVIEAINTRGADIVFFWGLRVFPELRGIQVPVVHVSHSSSTEEQNPTHEEYCKYLGKSQCNFMAGVCRSAVGIFPKEYRKLDNPTVIYNGADMERTRPVFGREWQRKAWGITPESKVMLYVGRFYPGKGADVALEALRLLSDDWHLVMYGWGEEEERLKKSAFGSLRPSSTGSKSRVFWPQPRLRQLGDVYAAADCVVIPSRSEAFPLVMVEAWQAGVPVVCSAFATLDEIEEHYSEGRPLVRRVPCPPTPGELAEVVKVASVDASTKEAHDVACASLTASAMTGRWESYLYECVSIWHETGRDGMVKTSPTSVEV